MNSGYHQDLSRSVTYKTLLVPRSGKGYTESLVYQNRRLHGHGDHLDHPQNPVEKFLNNFKNPTPRVLRPKDLARSYTSPGVPSDLKKALFKPTDTEIYSRKVFVGGLPIDIHEEEVRNTFRIFGKVLVDWPRRLDATKEGGRSMSGYAFLIFEEEVAVQRLVQKCHESSGRLYLFVTSPTMRDKPVQVRPWRLSDADYMSEPLMNLDSRFTVFIGGVPRPTKAHDLAEAVSRYYGPAAYVGIDTDPELKYPKGCARVTFTSATDYINAISGRYVYLTHAEVEKRVEIKPYLMEEQMCDECGGKRCHGRYASYFCGHEMCFQYYCENCWDSIHVGEWSSHCPSVRIGEQTKVLQRPYHHNGGRLRSRPYRG